jgi:hypothetical protein
MKPRVVITRNDAAEGFQITPAIAKCQHAAGQMQTPL